MSINRKLGDLANVLDDGTEGQFLKSTGSGDVAFDDVSAGVTVYATITAMTDVTNPSAGDLAYVTANTGLYQNNGNGWYKIATINTSPDISSVNETTSGSTTTLSANGTFDLTVGANTVVTITASDADEGTDLIYSHTVTSGNTSDVATITQGTGASENVFTFAPASATGGTLVVRFDVTDNTNTAQFTNSFTLTFLSWSSATQQAKIQASDAESSDSFSYNAVSISNDGDTAIVGAYNEDTTASNAGSAYIFTRSGTSWSQQAKIQASDAQATDYFGYSVAISGDGNTAIVSAYAEDTTATWAGSAYIFTRSGASWSEQAKIQGSDVEAYSAFGISVSISNDGDTAIIGSYAEDSEAGSVYIFTRSGTSWSEQAELNASDAQAGDNFGYSVSISNDGDKVIVGAANEDTGGSNAGAAYVFTRSGASWSQQAKIQASDKGANDKFGTSVSISNDGDTAIVGAYGEDTTAGEAGSAYVFTRSGASWSQQAKIQASDAESSDFFGFHVDLSGDGDTTIVGAANEDTGGSNAGSAYVFTRSGTSWSQQKKIQASDAQAGDNFGYGVSISNDGSTAIVGAYNEDTTASNAGSAYIFVAG
jgi:hypothetical protein